MYVMPFWSYKLVENACTLTNWLTHRSRIAPPALIHLLDRIHNGHMPGNIDSDEDQMLRMAKSLNILFESQECADEWLREIEANFYRATPTIDQIELTNRCPYSCKMCPRTVAMDRALGNMSLELFERIIEQIGGRQEYVALHHFGESLVHPGLPKAVEIAHRHGLETGLSCNPPSLHPPLAARLLKAGISNLVLSLDSLNAKIYVEVRGSAARLEIADQNIRNLVKLRDEGGYATFITLQMINMNCNEAEADRFLEYCGEVGVDRGLIIRLGRWDFDDGYLATLGEFTSPGYGGYCSRPWESLVVLWDGQVVPCCHDYNGAVVLGDLKQNSLDDIWQSARAAHFRDMNQSYDLCQRCSFSRWYREHQRDHEGFLRFHKERGNGRDRKEWINPASLSLAHAQLLFDGFDIMIDE